METIKVNMSPNPLDVQTIHASQNDGEARQWEFELHNNGELIDTSDVKEQLVFKSYKGGTEQLLPENGSTPTTSPFIGDIKYPQGLLTDQEFTYRQSPTEEDGNAKITDIKGNTIVWNQLVQNGNFADTNSWDKYNCALSVSNNVATITATAASGNIYTPTSLRFTPSNGDKILVCGKIKAGTDIARLRFNVGGTINITENATTTWQTVENIVTAGSSGTGYAEMFAFNSGTAEYKDIMIFNLTKMGLDSITDPIEFSSLFNLPFYDYNQGTLIPFSGNGIKTVGFNQWDEEWESGRINSDGTKASSSTYIRSKNYIHIFPNTTYYRKSPNNIQPFYYDGNMNFISYGFWGANLTFSTPNNAEYMLFHIDPTYGTTYKNDICINISDTERNGQYEPYTTSTLSLPISTYFPTGMKSAGDAYDELTPSKTIKRMDRIDLGSITYTRVESQTSGVYFFVGSFRSIPDIKVKTNYDVWNIKTPMYETVPSANIYLGTAQNKTIGGYDARTVRIRDDSFTDATAFKNSLSGQYLIYEINTPTETSFTTASLVTENGEVALANENGVLVGRCNSDISADAGFIEGKIKMSDSDGDVYSSKIQIHVERSPQ